MYVYVCMHECLRGKEGRYSFVLKIHPGLFHKKEKFLTMMSSG